MDRGWQHSGAGLGHGSWLLACFLIIDCKEPKESPEVALSGEATSLWMIHLLLTVGTLVRHTSYAVAKMMPEAAPVERPLVLLPKARVCRARRLRSNSELMTS